MEKRAFNIDGVIVKTDSSYEHRFRVLRMAMDNWAKKNRNLPIDTPEAKQYSKDSDRYNKLKELFEFHKPNFIKPFHMVELNKIFKRYNNL